MYIRWFLPSIAVLFIATSLCIELSATADEPQNVASTLPALLDQWRGKIEAKGLLRKATPSGAIAFWGNDERAATLNIVKQPAAELSASARAVQTVESYRMVGLVSAELTHFQRFSDGRDLISLRYKSGEQEREAYVSFVKSRFSTSSSEELVITLICQPEDCPSLEDLNEEFSAALTKPEVGSSATGARIVSGWTGLLVLLLLPAVIGLASFYRRRRSEF